MIYFRNTYIYFALSIKYLKKVPVFKKIIDICFHLNSNIQIMKQFNLIRNLFFLIFITFSWSALSQTITGTITGDDGQALPFVNVIEKGTSNGTTSDENGKFTLNVEKIPTTIIFSSLGFTKKEQDVISGAPINVTLSEDGVGLDEIVILGNRAKERTILDSPVPIDIVDIKELASSGQVSVDQMLTYKIPSYNASNQTISDATAHFDPADLRGLGPSRTLVLVNGKRKNQSALVYINDTPGKGEVGTDMKSIPVAAIERIEVLRDGASAQYGSDAIAGVINIVLKENVEYTTVRANTGITTEGDGFLFDADINTSFNVANDGFINLTLGVSSQDHTNRAGEPGEDILFGVSADDPTWGDWLAENPGLGMTIGQPDMQKGEFMLNAGFPFKNGNGEIYAFAGLTYRKGKSFALFRTPYWVGDPFNLLHESGTEYNGFQPTFETNIFDSMDGLGVKFELGEFNIDVSGTFGINTVDYTIGNTLNVDLGADSPTSFDAGAYKFQNLLGNIDVTRNFGDISLAFGMEARTEKFTVNEGEPDSYFGSGAQSFPGLQPSNALSEDRNNIGVYADVEWDISDAFLIGGAIRYENFSDFGGNTSWKLNGRYKLGQNGAIRASVGTGFRAPALHQIYLSNIQTLISGGTVSNQGTFNNVDPVIVDGLGVPALKAETSNNISAGITYKFTRNFYVSLDYYNIKVDDRVLFTGEIGYQDGGPGDPDNNPVEEILDEYDVTSLKFFTNAVDTKTNGIDIVANYNNVKVGSGDLGFMLAFNWNKTEIVGNVTTPPILEDNGYEIFNRKEGSRIETSRPSSKGTLGINYNIKKFHASFNNTYFGNVTWKHFDNGLNGGDFGDGPIPTDDEDFDQVYAGKVITDLILGFDISEKFVVSATVNNLFNVYPDVIDTKGDFVTDLGGRFKYPWEVNQFGFYGTMIKAGIAFKF